ncbi:MAG: hypothetical protein ACOX4Z_07565 [Desulfobulbus sp.]|jgi:hypothetical protein
MAAAFTGASEQKSKSSEAQIKELHAKIGQFTMDVTMDVIFWPTPSSVVAE